MADVTNNRVRSLLLGRRLILVYGGSFDPPHRAHIALPQQVAAAIGADAIAYIPAGRAPHKLDKDQTEPRLRLGMLQLALRSNPGPVYTALLTQELERSATPSYTVETLESLRHSLGEDVTLRLLIGADQLRIFDTWRDPERIIELAEPVVMVRPPDTEASLLDSLRAEQRDAWSMRLVKVDALDISSTDIRERVAAGLPIDALVCDSVAAFIQEHGLYK